MHMYISELLVGGVICRDVWEEGGDHDISAKAENVAEDIKEMEVLHSQKILVRVGAGRL